MADIYGGNQGLLAAGGFVEGLAKGLMDMEDRNYRKMELDAKLEAQRQDRERERQKDEVAQRDRAFDNKAKLAAAGYVVPEGVEGDDIYNLDFSTLKPNYGLLRAKSEAGALNDPYGLKAAAAQKAAEEAEERRRRKTPQGKIEGLSGDQRKRFDDTAGALDALYDIDKAYTGTQRASFEDNADMIDVPLRGGTDFTIARDQFVESLGRLQSGGAITADEHKNWKNLIPGPMDKPEIAQKKLSDLKFRMESRLKTFGLDPEGARGAGFLKPREGLVKKTGLINPTQKMSAEDKQAYQWAVQNSKEKEAQQILKTLKSQYGF